MSYFKCGQVFVTDNSNTSIKDATGAIASFNTLLASPLVSLKAGFIATQEAGTPTPSEPKAINGVSSIKVYHRGANLWDGIFEQGDISSTTGIDNPSTTRWRTKNYIAVKPNTRCYLCNSEGTTKSLRGRGYDKDKNYIGILSISTGGSYLIPENVYYIRFSPNDVDIPNHDVSVNYPNTDTEYHAYNENSDEVTIALGGTYYGGYVSQDKDGKRELVVTHKIQSFNVGNWSYGLWGNRYFFSQRLLDAKPNSVSSVLANSLCDIYEQQTPSNIYTHDTIGYCINNDFIRVQDNNYNSLDDWKNAVKNYNYVYELAEPFTVALSDGEPIITLNGTNNIFADGDTEVKYTASPFVIGNASGSVANFTTPYTKPLISLQVDALATKVYQRGANLWDGDWEVGTYNTNTGNKEKSSTRIRSKNLIPIAPNSTIYFTQIGTGVGISFLFYDKNGTFKNGYYRANTTGGFSYTTQSDWYFLAISPSDAYGTTYNNDIAVRFDNSFDYVAYNPNSNEYVIADLGNITTLSGVNNIFADSGDIVECKYWGANT